MEQLELFPEIKVIDSDDFYDQMTNQYTKEEFLREYPTVQSQGCDWLEEKWKDE